jgi:acetyl esterase
MNPMSKTYRLSDEMQAFVAQSERLQTLESELGARRAAYERISRHFTPPRPEGVLVRNASVGAIDVRIYCPAEGKPAAGWPVLLYLHGGGWNTGNLDTHDWIAFAILQRLSWAVVAVDHRLAPRRHIRLRSVMR